MSDWNQYPDWHPLEWAALNQQKQQGISNTIGDFFNKAYDVFKQRSQNDWEVNTLLPAQTSAQEGLASFTNQLPMTAAESATSGNQTSELEETKTYHRNLEKIMNDQNLSEAERSAARDAETERHNKADEDIARLQAQNSGSGSESAAAIEAKNGMAQQILGEQAISLNAYDQMTKQFDWDILRKNVDKIVNAVPAFIRSHGLQGADVKATQDYIRSLIMNGAQAGGLTDLVPKPDTFDWNAAKSARPSGAGAISGDFGSPESILGKLARALFPNSNAQTSGSGLSGQRQITDYKYRKTRAGGYALVNKKTGAVASSDDVQWYLAHGGRKP